MIKIWTFENAELLENKIDEQVNKGYKIININYSTILDADKRLMHSALVQFEQIMWGHDCRRR